uniref:Uncharacterized protein n=1 Tax=Avena sativa TaxID=4498 RepID=A0ACD5WPE3_AVESA
MLPYATSGEAEAALGRAMTWAEAAWFRYSAATPDYCLYYHHIVIFLAVYTLAPVPLALLELGAPAISLPYKLQPKVRLSPAAFLRCYLDTVRVFLLTMGPVQLLSYPAVKMVGIRTGLPLPSAGETAAQLAVYLLIEDYLGYWMHRLLHTRFEFPLNPANLIPFYGGASHHDYHHRVGGKSQSNFASIFTFCDYLYGTDKGYRYHKTILAKLKEMTENNTEKTETDNFISGKQE